jgi:hypothetical protein
MTCQHCETKSHVYNMKCIVCAARHCLMAFIPDHIKKWDYVKQVAQKYKFDARTLAEKVKEIK